MEPVRETDPELSGVLAELVRREPIFHREEFGRSREAFAAMTVEDFWEVGASGRRYTREAVLDLLEERYSGSYEDMWEATDFQCRRLAHDTYLLTYTLLQDRVPAYATFYNLAEHKRRVEDRLSSGNDRAG